MLHSYAVRSLLQFLLTSIGILLIGSLPYLFFNMESQLDVLKMVDQKQLTNTLFIYDTLVINFEEYLNHIKYTLNLLFTNHGIQYYERGREVPLFPEFLEAYIQSMLYLLASLLLALVLGMLLTILTMLLPKEKRAFPKGILFVFESLPDIFVIMITQLVIIWIYKTSGFLLFNIASGYHDRAILLPIVVLALLPALYIYKYLLVSFEDEEKQLYVELARGKGLKRSRILVVHIFRNSILTLFNHFKGVFLFGLANLVMLEVIFEVRGFMTFVINHGVLNPEIVTIALFMIFIPSFLFFTGIQWILERWFQVKEDLI